MLEPLNRFLILGVATHVYGPNRKTDWIMVTYKCTNVIVPAPSFPNIRSSQDQLFLYFQGLAVTAYQYSSVAFRRLPRYLKDKTVSSGRL